MKEYRCTRNQPYLDPKCFGFADMAARQGYYLKAESENEALAQMAQLFPNEVSVGFTAQEWKNDWTVCRGQGKGTPLKRSLYWHDATAQPHHL
jgi:hypothetical protein